MDGLIVPDLPPDEPEAEELAALCGRFGIAPIYLLAPTSTAERIELAVARSKGFVYLVSVTGITGARTTLAPDLSDFVRRVRAVAERRPLGERPYLAVGFGISSPELSAQVAQIADGVIVGSALVRLAGSSADPVRDVAARARRWRKRRRGLCRHDRTMNAPSTDFTSRREQEGRRIHRALFRHEIPSILLEHYLIAAERMDVALGVEELDAYYRAVETQDDLEALEFAARLTGRLPLLRRKFQAMVYLAETLPDHQGSSSTGDPTGWVA